METERMKELRERFEKKNRSWVAVVRNMASSGKNAFMLTTNFYSDVHDLKNILHKIELDLMTNLEHGFNEPIQIAIKEIKKKKL